MRISTKITRKSRIPQIQKKIATAKTRILFRQGAYLRKVAQYKIKTAKRPLKKKPRVGSARIGVEISTPGGPPFQHRTKGNGGIKRSIRYAVDKSRGVATVGYTTGKRPEIPIALERGGITRGPNGPQRIAARPLMGPSLHSPTSRATFKKIVKDEYSKAWR